MNSVQRAQWLQKKNSKKRARLTANKKKNNTLRPIRRAENRQKLRELKASMVAAMQQAAQSTPEVAPVEPTPQPETVTGGSIESTN